MVASTDIKFYVHSNNNAPQLQNAYGSMIGVLDACLVNGISLGLVSSLTAIGTTVTAVFSTAHNLLQYQVLKIAGANQSEYNGEHRILTVPNATSVTFELGSTPSTTTATGTITASLPPLGWEKPFSSANAAGGGKAAYRSKNMLLPSRPFLRVVDELDPAYTATYAKFAKVGLVEDMVSIDTLIGVQAPYDALNPDKNWVGTGSGTSAINGWAKWYYAAGSLATTISDAATPASGSRNWVLAGNSDYFFIFPAVATGINNYSNYGFGAFNSFLSADNSNNFLSAMTRYVSAGTGGYRGEFTGLGATTSSGATLIQRNFKQDANHITARAYSAMVRTSSGDIYSGTANHIADKSIANLIPFFPVFFKETTSDIVRGELPNFYWLFQDKPYTNLSIIENNGSAYIAINSFASGSEGQVIVKIGDL